ncbi:ABC transporter permease [Roseibium limicola]|uniref:Autoinducer 2 import system permease protein LsrD n=1 Tax=Roseibium limicola TaxID=2816037 RepID=A0A939J5Y2_9HYPH|nr:ABC transporter permease [Roseibium limicola]MBO0346310.1 ABC transporter permease [Roseibium limicola]
MTARLFNRVQLDADALVPWIASLIVILVGATVFPKFLSAGYLLQQLQIASFLGVLATGAMVVILLGHIDLSIPWVLGGAAILSTSLAGTGNPALVALAIPAALAFGALVGVINGIGVSIFRIPSMVWTLAVNAMLLGVAVLNTGGFNPKGEASALMSSLSTGSTIGLPHALIVWLCLCLLVFAILKRTTFGRYLIAIGNSEKATYLSGVETPRIVFGAFMLAGACSALGGVLLAGYANQAYQSMGDPYLMPTIAAVVIGGTSILGGKGSFVGTIGGAIFITLLTSVLSVMQISEAWRQIIFGSIVLSMLLAQNLRRRKA